MSTEPRNATGGWDHTCYIALFRDRHADWQAFADASLPGYRRAQHRYIGAGASGKAADPLAIAPGNFTLSVMYVPTGEGNAAHSLQIKVGEKVTVSPGTAG